MIGTLGHVNLLDFSWLHRKSRRQWSSTLALALLATPSWAEPPSNCEEWEGQPYTIVFEGNNTTRKQTLAREVNFIKGKKFSLTALEEGRQAIQDLGLFRQISARCEETDAGKQVVYSVREKYYLIPAPRFDANSDGQTAWGAQVRWDNVAGLNHSLVAKVLRREQKEVGRGASNDIGLRYRVPYLGNSPWGLTAQAAFVEQRVEHSSIPDFVEQTQEFALSFHRDLDFAAGAASQGLSASLGLGWIDAKAIETTQPVHPGSALQIPWSVRFTNRRDHIYSVTGTHAQVFGRVSDEAVMSDYGEVLLGFELKSAWTMGTTRHQTLDLAISVGNRTGGPDDEQYEYSVGGSKSIRAYKLNSQRGDTQFQASADWYTQVIWPWLRMGPFVEAGRAWRGENESSTQWLVGAGLGMQLRLTWFVDAVINFGYAFPLQGGEGGRFYARGD